MNLYIPIDGSFAVSRYISNQTLNSIVEYYKTNLLKKASIIQEIFNQRPIKNYTGFLSQ